MKDHEIRELVSSLTKIAQEYGQTQQLREHIREAVFKAIPPSFLASSPTASVSEPVAWAVYWGLGEMRKNSVHFEKQTADKVASEIKSHTEVRPLVFAASVSEPDNSQAVALSAEQERDWSDGICQSRHSDWRPYAAAADAVSRSADVWAGFGIQDAKVCIEAYMSAKEIK